MTSREIRIEVVDPDGKRWEVSQFIPQAEIDRGNPKLARMFADTQCHSVRAKVNEMIDALFGVQL